MKLLYQRLLIKASLIYFLIGVLLGFFMELANFYPSFEFIWRYRTTHVHLLLVGFVIQLIVGVALWMFPRKSKGTPEEKLRALEVENKRGLLLFYILNAGTIIRSIFEGISDIGKLYSQLALLGMFLQVVAVFYFLILLFPRVRIPGR